MRKRGLKNVRNRVFRREDRDLRNNGKPFGCGNQDLARVIVTLTGENLEKCGLSRAGIAEQADALALLNRERKVAQDVVVAIKFIQF